MKKIITVIALTFAAISMSACGLQTAEGQDEVVAQGPQGPKGDPGDDGEDGKDGKDGTDGKDATGGSGGSSGAAGSAGDAGSAGSAGEAGAAGSAGCAGEAGAGGSGGCDCGGSGGSAGEAGAAGSGGEDGGAPYDVSCGTEYPVVTQPMYSPAAWQLSLSGQYLPDGTTSVYLVGELPIPGFTWQNGISASYVDGRWLVKIPEGTNAGTYNVSYKGPGESWADYGAVEERVACMHSEAKAWLWCETALGSDGDYHLNGCGLRIKIHSNGTITAAGNTGSWQ